MRLTRAADYAIRVLIYLAGQESGARARREEIVEHTGVPHAFLNKLVQRLAHAGLVSARPGVRGGCSLEIPAEGISILRVVETIDGPLRVTECLADAAACPSTRYCNLRTLLLHLQDEISRILGNATVASLARDGPGSLPCISVDECRCDRTGRT
nr:IclR helix-turn-helix domain protein [uncultured bacterium]